MPEKQYPRRRDVREMLAQLYAALDARVTAVEFEGTIVPAEFTGTVPATDFDRDFLNDVRDIMRDGFDFMGAVGIALDDGDDEAQAAIETAVADAFNAA